ncbi:MAG: CDP-glycerol glycerophosphotransferase family protein [Bifidobacteriaceae bacterium]|jgi:hypothetical protein|nr:CDP-glycerol glycerophosphotransferase family protein [Bifidobacteriaceae bacterium]
MPKGIPDGRGDEAQIARDGLNAQVIVYFADTMVGLYQLRPWYAPLRELHKVHPVIVVGTDSRAVAAIRRESGLEAYTISHYSTIDLILERSKTPIRLALYVNHNAANFTLLSFTQLVHVSIMHGDSDKVVSVSGQTKAYDFTFVAGQGAIDRLNAYLPLYPAAERCIIIGRPQVSAPPTGVQTKPNGAANGRSTVLYAPTWEGGTASAEYSSLEEYGEAIVRSVLADQRFRLVYRPHPLTGTRLARFGQANSRVQALVETAARATPGAGHRVSRGGAASKDLGEADLLVSDVSSLAIDFLVTGRPLVITVPPRPEVRVAPTVLLQSTPRLGREELDNVAAYLGELLETDPGAAERRAAAEYYLGDTRPGAAVKTFIAACGRLIKLGERNWSAVERALHHGEEGLSSVAGMGLENKTRVGGLDATTETAVSGKTETGDIGLNTPLTGSEGGTP